MFLCHCCVHTVKFQSDEIPSAHLFLRYTGASVSRGVLGEPAHEEEEKSGSRNIRVFLRIKGLHKNHFIWLPAVGVNAPLICPIHCIFYNPPVRTGVGMELYNFATLFSSFSTSHTLLNPHRSSARSSSFYPPPPPPRSVSPTFVLHLWLFQVILSLSLLSPLPPPPTVASRLIAATNLSRLCSLSTLLGRRPSRRPPFRCVPFIFLLSDLHLSSPRSSGLVQGFHTIDYMNFPPTMRGRTGHTVNPPSPSFSFSLTLSSTSIFCSHITPRHLCSL